jgi:hypothetical protein
MLARRHVRLALAAVFVCGLARPAFADGALGGLQVFGRLVICVLVLFALGIIVLIGVAIHAARKPQAGERTEKAESSELPEARAMNERSRSGPKQ